MTNGVERGGIQGHEPVGKRDRRVKSNRADLSGGVLMKWPELVPDSVCTIPVKIQFEDGINEDGSPKKAVLFEGNCNYSENSKQVLDQERRLVQLQATALFNGDIAPGLDISGEVVINGGTVIRRIYSSSRARNPDGTVNFTKLELM